METSISASGTEARIGNGCTGFPATLTADLITHSDAGHEIIFKKGTRIAVLKLPAHCVTDMAGHTEVQAAGLYCGTPDGNFWMDLKDWQFAAEA